MQRTYRHRHRSNSCRDVAYGDAFEHHHLAHHRQSKLVFLAVGQRHVAVGRHQVAVRVPAFQRYDSILCGVLLHRQLVSGCVGTRNGVNAVRAFGQRQLQFFVAGSYLLHIHTGVGFVKHIHVYRIAHLALRTGRITLRRTGAHHQCAVGLLAAKSLVFGKFLT